MILMINGFSSDSNVISEAFCKYMLACYAWSSDVPMKRQREEQKIFLSDFYHPINALSSAVNMAIIKFLC